MKLPALALATTLLFTSGCAPSDPKPVESVKPIADHPEVARLAERAFARQVEESIFLQVRRGLRVTEIPDFTPESQAIFLADARRILAEVGHLEGATLNERDRTTLAILAWDAQSVLDGEPFYWNRFPFTPYLGGFLLSQVQEAFAAYEFKSADDAVAYSKLVREFADLLDQFRAHAEEQMARGIYLPKPALPGVIGLFRAFRDNIRQTLRLTDERLQDLTDEQPTRVIEKLDGMVRDQVEPAFDRFLALLDSDEYRAGAPDAVGVSQYPDGEAYYRSLVRFHTTMDQTPEELHELGKQRVADLSERMAAIRQEVGFDGNQQEFHAHLRSDPRFLADSPAEVEARFNEFIARIEPLLGDYFRTLPDAPYGVARLDPAVEASMTFGYYNPPTPQEDRGLYYYNGSKLDERSLVFAGPLIYHELVPGHHLHFASQKENESLPEYRREYFGAGAFNEGWGNYGALLASEMGLLDDPYDRYGWAIFDMFISVRLVVDTGMNLMGWSLEEARDYMREHTFQSETEIATETLRYATDMPGQALGYKAGLEELLRLRSRYQEARGSDYDIRDFHQLVLGDGAMPMMVLEERVEQAIR